MVGKFHGAPNEIHLYVLFCISQQGFLAGVVSGCFLKGLFDGRQGSPAALHPSLLLHLHK